MKTRLTTLKTFLLISRRIPISLIKSSIQYFNVTHSHLSTQLEDGGVQEDKGEKKNLELLQGQGRFEKKLIITPTSVPPRSHPSSAHPTTVPQKKEPKVVKEEPQTSRHKRHKGNVSYLLRLYCQVLITTKFINLFDLCVG